MKDQIKNSKMVTSSQKPMFNVQQLEITILSFSVFITFIIFIMHTGLIKW